MKSSAPSSLEGWEIFKPKNSLIVNCRVLFLLFFLFERCYWAGSDRAEGDPKPGQPSEIQARIRPKPKTGQKSQPRTPLFCQSWAFYCLFRFLEFVWTS